MEIDVIKVYLFGHNKWYNCKTSLLDLKKDMIVVVDGVNGLESGRVVSQVFKAKETEGEQQFTVIRVQTERDARQEQENREREKEILKNTKTLADSFKLDMKIVKCFLSLDGAKLVVFFTSEDRVDFRELVKELVKTYKVKIELRQIGARDEVKLIGALGPCGKECCCSKGFNNFCQVSIKQAKVQNLSLNPANISGMCGKLMCCLSYESEHYKESLEMMPKLNTIVTTPDGQGICVYNNLLKHTVDVKFKKDENAFEIKTYALKDIKF